MDYRCRLVLQNTNCHSLRNKINETFGEITLNYGKGNGDYANMSACHLSSTVGHEHRIVWTMQTADKRVESMFKVQQEGSFLLKASSNDGKAFTFGT